MLFLPGVVAHAFVTSFMKHLGKHLIQYTLLQVSQKEMFWQPLEMLLGRDLLYLYLRFVVRKSIYITFYSFVNWDFIYNIASQSCQWDEFTSVECSLCIRDPGQLEGYRHPCGNQGSGCIGDTTAKFYTARKTGEIHCLTYNENRVPRTRYQGFLGH